MWAQVTASLPAGLDLPKHGSMFGITVKDKVPELTQLHATEIVHNLHAGSNLARGLVYAGPRATVELDGVTSAIHLFGGDVSFLAKLSDDETDLMRNRLALVKLQSTEKRRVVSTYSQNVFGGQRKRIYDIVPVKKLDVAGGEWVRLVPEQPLPPGEYGIVIMPKDATLFPDAVYDFEVQTETTAPATDPHQGS